MTLACTNTHQFTQTQSRMTHAHTHKQTIILQPTGPWAPMRMDRRVGSSLSALSLCPLSNDSCFLTKPTLFQTDPVIMRLCPGLQATREQCQQLRADLLNGPSSPRSSREHKAAPYCLGGQEILASGVFPVFNSNGVLKQWGFMCIHTTCVHTWMFNHTHVEENYKWYLTLRLHNNSIDNESDQTRPVSTECTKGRGKNLHEQNPLHCAMLINFFSSFCFDGGVQL